MRPIFDYFDYRDALRDFFDAKKLTNPLYSYRMFGNRLGMDQSQLFRILAKSLHLPSRLVEPLAKEMELSGRELDFFRCLVMLGRCKRESERKILLDQLMGLRDVAQHTLTREEYAFLSNPRMVAVRALIALGGIREENLKSVAASLQPPVSVETVREDLQVLLRLGLLVQKKNGEFDTTTTHISTGQGHGSLAVREYQRQILSWAQDALELPKSERDFATICLTADQECLEDIREIMRECRRQIQKRVERVSKSDRVLQLAFATYPLARRSL